MNSVIWKLVKQVYASSLRPVLLKAVDNPDVEWDDWLMRFVDNIFEYAKES